jgi:maleate isomerase
MSDGRVGVLVPPANTTVEPELWDLMPRSITVHTSRLPGRVAEDTSTGMRERFLGYNETLASSADSFGGLNLDSLGYACTGASYLVGPSGEEALLAKLRAGGVNQVNTAARAITDVLRSMRRERIGLVSPYPAWLTELASGYWQASGFEVSGFDHVAGVVSIYNIEPEDVVHTGLRVAETKPDALLLSGTGMCSLEPIELLSDQLDIPVISSNVCLAWWLMGAVPGDHSDDASSAALTILQRWL